MTKTLALIVITFTAIGFSCKHHTNKPEQYSYAFYYLPDIIPYDYLIKEIIQTEQNRIVITYSSKTKTSYKKTEAKHYRVVNNGLDIEISHEGIIEAKPYLRVDNPDCINFKYGNEMDDVLATQICFLKRLNITIGNKEYKNAYKFKKTTGLNHSVESNVYYDSAFVLLKEEYVSGYTDPYIIVRLNENLINDIPNNAKP